VFLEIEALPEKGFAADPLILLPFSEKNIALKKS